VSSSTCADASPATSAAAFATATPKTADVATLLAICSCFSLTNSRNCGGTVSNEKGRPTFQLPPTMQPHWYSAPVRYVDSAAKAPVLRLA